MAEWNKRTLKHIDYEEDKVKQWRGNTITWIHSGETTKQFMEWRAVVKPTE